MAKLLSQDEITRIAAMMTAEYGLPPPKIVEEESYYGSDWRVRIIIYRKLRIPRWKYFKSITRDGYLKIRDFSASDYEDALVTLERELKKFDPRTTLAEHYRQKYAMQEADEALNDILQTPPVV